MQCLGKWTLQIVPIHRLSASAVSHLYLSGTQPTRFLCAHHGHCLHSSAKNIIYSSYIYKTINVAILCDTIHGQIRESILPHREFQSFPFKMKTEHCCANASSPFVTRAVLSCRVALGLRRECERGRWRNVYNAGKWLLPAVTAPGHET